jgi:hypothetical protein
LDAWGPGRTSAPPPTPLTSQPAQGSTSTCESPRVPPAGAAGFRAAPTVAEIGYARVSNDHQSLDQQQDALVAAGCERIFADQLSGSRDDRPGLAALLDYARIGDAVLVVALDRLGRSLSGVIRNIETLAGTGVQLRSLREASTTPPRPAACSLTSSPPWPTMSAPSCTGARRLLAPLLGFGADIPAGRRSSHRRRPDRSEPCAGGESISELVAATASRTRRLPGSARQRPGAASA